MNAHQRRKRRRYLAPHEADLIAFLAYAGMPPDRMHTTADGSHLYEYWRERDACVDIYPSGSAIVIIGSVVDGVEKNNVHTLRLVDHKNDVVELLRRAPASENKIGNN